MLPLLSRLSKMGLSDRPSRRVLSLSNRLMDVTATWRWLAQACPLLATTVSCAPLGARAGWEQQALLPPPPKLAAA